MNIENAETKAGTNTTEINNAINTPREVNIPKSRIMVRYAPKTNEIKPKAVVIPDRNTGIIIYFKAIINAFLLSFSLHSFTLLIT